MTIWNANVDANQPRHKNELLADLASWEKAHLRPSNQPAKAQWSDNQWKNKHEGQFDTLIAAAKTRTATTKKKEEDPSKEAAHKEVYRGTPPAEGMGTGSHDYPEHLRDINSMTETQSTTLPVEAVSGPLSVGTNGSGVPMTTMGPNIGFHIVAAQTDERSWGQDPNRIGADFSSHNGKRKYNEIVGASITEAVKNGVHK